MEANTSQATAYRAMQDVAEEMKAAGGGPEEFSLISSFLNIFVTKNDNSYATCQVDDAGRFFVLNGFVELVKRRCKTVKIMWCSQHLK